MALSEEIPITATAWFRRLNPSCESTSAQGAGRITVRGYPLLPFQDDSAKKKDRQALG